MRAFHPVSSPMPVARFLFPHASDIFPPSSNVCCRLLFAAIVLLLLWAPVLFQPSIAPPPIPSLLLSHGLYVATLLLVRVWGRQVRRFPSPFRAYGLNLLGSQREVSHPWQAQALSFAVMESGKGTRVTFRRISQQHSPLWPNPCE